MNKTDIPPDAIFDLTELGASGKLRDAINQVPLPDPDDSSPQQDLAVPLVELTGLKGQDNACMRLTHGVRIHATGDLGDFAFACCDGPETHLEGNVGDGACEGIAGGVIRITGNAGCGLGAAMRGGTLAVYGSAGARVGAAMRGGSIFVRGNVGEDTGVGALAGTIVIGGDAGPNLGDALNNVTVFIRGKASSLAPGCIEAPLRKREEVRLGLLLMSASIRGSSGDFRRVIPEARWRAEESGAGEVRPNWR